jgi:hypothetical protein
MKTKTLLLLLTLLLTGCGKVYVERRVPTTDAQRQAIAAHAEKLLAATPHTLAGHDQDWDDAIKQAEEKAMLIYCPPTYWEWDRTNSTWTGRWHYAEGEAKP